MSRLRIAASAACCFFALFSGQAMAAEEASCWQPYEVEAAKVRDLHVMLMLGSLKCKSLNVGLADKYSAFTDRHIGLLSSYNNVLKARFMRTSGISDGLRAYEEFNTKLGNTHSGNPQTASYCQMMDTLLTVATDARDTELPKLAQNFSESRMGIETVCAAVAAPVTIAATAASAPAPAPTATPPAPPVPASVAIADPPASSTSAVAALEAAAVALQTAAASLKAQPATPTATPSADVPTALPTAQPASATIITPAG